MEVYVLVSCLEQMAGGLFVGLQVVGLQVVGLQVVFVETWTWLGLVWVTYIPKRCSLGLMATEVERQEAEELWERQAVWPGKPWTGMEGAALPLQTPAPPALLGSELQKETET